MLRYVAVGCRQMVDAGVTGEVLVVGVTDRRWEESCRRPLVPDRLGEWKESGSSAVSEAATSTAGWQRECV